MNPHPHEAWRDRLEQQFPAVQSSMPKRQLLADFEAVELFIAQTLEQDRREQRELFAAKVQKLHDKYQNELHGGYDDADALMQREMALNEVLALLQDNVQ